VTYHTLGQVHSDWVRRVKYIPLKEFVISCSGSGKDSLVVRDIDDKKRKTYIFKVAKVSKMSTEVEKMLDIIYGILLLPFYNPICLDYRGGKNVSQYIPFCSDFVADLYDQDHTSYFFQDHTI